MSNNTEYQHIYSKIKESLTRINKIEDDNDIINPYVDEYTTTQQRARDRSITELLKLYVNAYNYKNESNKNYKKVLFTVCVGILLFFSSSLVFLVFKSFNMSNYSLESTIELLSICVTFLTLIISILRIITKYVFPLNDEKYITRIVELIQNNDLENKKTNILANTTKKDNRNDSNNPYDSTTKGINL